MGKKTAKRKTRWRTLSIGEIASDTEDENQDETRWKRAVHQGYNGHYYGNGTRSGQSHQPYQRHQHRFNGNSQQLSSSHSSYNKYNNSSSFSSHSTPTRHRSYHQTNDDKYKMSRSNSTASEPKITFNEDEYTRITTPRQDVLFKKGYLSKKKPTVQTNGETISTSASATPTLTGGSCGESNPSTGYSSTTGGGTPEHTSLDGGDFYESELEHPQPFIFPNTYVDGNALYYINTYDPYGQMMLMGPPPGRFVHPVELYGPGPPPPLHCFPHIPTTNGNPHFDEFSYPITKRSSVDSQNEIMHNDEDNSDLAPESNEEEITNGVKQEEEDEESGNEDSQEIKDNSTTCSKMENGENHQSDNNDASNDEIVNGSNGKITEEQENGIKENNTEEVTESLVILQNGLSEVEECKKEEVHVVKVEEGNNLAREENKKEETIENGSKNLVMAVDAEEFIPMSMRRERQVSPEIRVKFENFLKRQDEYKHCNGNSFDYDYMVGDFVPSNHLIGPPLALQHAAVMHPPTVAAQQFINSFEYNKSQQQSQSMKPFVLQQNFNARTPHTYANRFNDNLVKKRRHFNRMKHINKDVRQKDNVINVTDVTSDLSNVEDKKIEAKNDSTQVAQNSTETVEEKAAEEINPPTPEIITPESTKIVSITENKSINEKSASPTNKSASSKPKPKQFKSPAKKLPVNCNNLTNKTNDSSIQKTEMKNYAQVLKKSTIQTNQNHVTPQTTNDTKEMSPPSSKASSTKSEHLYDEISIEKYNELLDNTSEWIAVPTRKKSKIKVQPTPKDPKDQTPKVVPAIPKPKPTETITVPVSSVSMVSTPPRPSPSPEKDEVPSDKLPKKSPKSNAKPVEPITKKKKNEPAKATKQIKPKSKSENKSEETNDISSSSLEATNTPTERRAKVSRTRNRMSHSDGSSVRTSTCDIAENIDKLREISSSDTTTNIDISQEIDRMIQKGLYANLGVPFESFSQTANDFMVGIIDPKLSNVLSSPNQSSGISSAVPRTTLSSTPSPPRLCLDAVAATTSLKPPQHYNHVEQTDENKVMKTLSECQKLFASKTNTKEIIPKAIFDSPVQKHEDDNKTKISINEIIDTENEVINDSQPENQDKQDQEIVNETQLIEEESSTDQNFVNKEENVDILNGITEDYSLLNGDSKEEVTEIEVKREDDTEVDVNSLSLEMEEIKDYVELNEDLVDNYENLLVNEESLIKETQENPLTASQTSQASDIMTKSLTEVVIQWLAETKEKSPDVEILKSPEQLQQVLEVDEENVVFEPINSEPTPKNVNGNPLFVASRNPKTIMSDLDKSWSFSDEENDNDLSVEGAMVTNRRVAKSLSPPDMAEEVTENNDRFTLVSKSLTENVVCLAREIVNTVKSPVLDGVELTPTENSNGINGIHYDDSKSKVFNNNNVLLLQNSIKGALVRDVAVIVRRDANTDTESKEYETVNGNREIKGANEGKNIFTPNNNNYNKSLSCTEKNLLIVDNDNEDCRKDNERLSDGEDDLLNYWDNDILNNEKQYEKTSGSSPIQITNNLSSNYDSSTDKVFKAKMFEGSEGTGTKNSVEDGVEVYESLYGKSRDYLEIKENVLLSNGVNVGKHPRNIDTSGTPPRRGGGAVCCSIM